MKLFPAERFVLSIIVALFVIDATLITLKGIRIDYAGYLVCGLLGGGIFVLGQFYRNSGRDLHIASALTSAGLFILFSLVASVFNYMFLPNDFPVVDPLLLRVDAALGYNWQYRFMDLFPVLRRGSLFRIAALGHSNHSSRS